MDRITELWRSVRWLGLILVAALAVTACETMTGPPAPDDEQEQPRDEDDES